MGRAPGRWRAAGAFLSLLGFRLFAAPHFTARLTRDSEAPTPTLGYGYWSVVPLIVNSPSISMTIAARLVTTWYQKN